MTEPTSSQTDRPAWVRRVFSKENLLALAICAILIVVVIVTSDSAPRWIYQGF